jgi:predicted amidohydrolase YtcJ
MTSTTTRNASRPGLLPGLIAALSLIGCGPGDDADPATVPGIDLVVINADVYTSDQERPRAGAFAVDEGRFIAIGDDVEIRKLAGKATRIVDAEGNTVIPGLIDGHTHLVSGSSLATGVDLSEIEDKAEWLRIIADKAEELADGEWILGGAWDHNLSDGVLPTREMLDRVAPDNPVLLRDIDGHSQWANSLAIELAGITADMPVPTGVEIVVDPDSGEMTGVFKEGGALFAGAPGLAEARDAEAGIRATIALANSLGITSVHDMSGNHDAFLSVMADGDLTLRVWQGYLGGRYSDADTQGYAEQAAAERERVRRRVEELDIEAGMGPLFELGYIKLMVDGVLSTYTALMNEPYSDNPDAHPEPFIGRDKLSAMVGAAHDNGFPVAVHAIGDQAVSWVLDAVAANPRPSGSLPDRIEHIEVVTPEDVSRFARLGVVASMQPHHATCCVGNYVIDRIGRERLPNAYVWRAMLDNDVPLVLGSDWSTSPFNPLIQIADTMHRETRIDGVVRPWDEGRTLSFREALTAYTATPASVTAWAGEIGSITVGKWADFVILDERLPVRVDRSIEDRRVTATFLAGRQVYPRL